MCTKAIKQTGYAILAGAVLTIGGASLTTSAQAAPLNINPIPTELIQSEELVEEVRSRHGFRGHRRGIRKFHRGHRSGFRSRGHNRGHFSRGHGKRYKSRHHSRHGSYRGQRFSRHGQLDIFSRTPRSR